MASEYVGRGLVMSSWEKCGPGGCFDDSELTAETERRHAEEAAHVAQVVAERKRRRDIRAHGTKQQKWELEWDEHYYQ